MASTKRPNVIFLISDQWRAESAGFCGNAVVRTPCIDALAADGAGFTLCFVQNPVSTPSRVAMATGRYCHVAGHRTMHHQLRAHEANMLRTFKENEYFVWWGGKNDMIASQCWDMSCDGRATGKSSGAHHYNPPYKAGDRLFYSFLQGKGPDAPDNDDAVVEEAVEFIRSWESSRPFFMLLNQGYPHPPYRAPEPFYSMYDRGTVPFPRRQKVPFDKKPRIMKAVHERMGLGQLTDAEWREIVAVYYGMVSKVDRNFSIVIEALKRAGLYDNSLIILSSDHGDYTGDYMLVEKMQNTFEDVLTNVPLAIRAPGCKPLGAPSQALCQWIDLMPTALEFAGIEPAETHFGKSLAPILRGETASIRDYVFSEGGALPTEAHTHEHPIGKEMVYWPRVSLQQEQPELHGKAVMIRSKRYKYVRRLYDTDELYDLQSDPLELNNRIDDPALAAARREMEQAMLDWFIETGDAVPWRWDKRGANEKHPHWSESARTYGTI